MPEGKEHLLQFCSINIFW